MFDSRIVMCLFVLLFLNQPPVLGADEMSDATFNQTHALIRRMLLNERIVYERPLAGKSSGEFKSWQDVIYRVTVYSADKCQVVYGRSLSRPEVDGQAAFSSEKGVSFDMTQVDRIALQAWSDFDPQVGRSKLLPSEMIMFYGPANVMSDGKGSTRPSHGITINSANSERILKAFQHLKSLCTP